MGMKNQSPLRSPRNSVDRKLRAYVAHDIDAGSRKTKAELE